MVLAAEASKSVSDGELVYGGRRDDGSQSASTFDASQLVAQPSQTIVMIDSAAHISLGRDFNAYFKEIRGIS